MDHMGDWWAFGWLISILVLALIILAIVALARWLFAGGEGFGQRRPLDILKERYARGEISREQYEQMRRDLEA